MSLEFCTFSSGSSGNCYLIRSETTALLVDVGISCKRIMEALEKTSTHKDMVKGILITHEHDDHVKGLRVTTKKLYHAMVYSTEVTWNNIQSGKHQIKDVEDFETNNLIEKGETFQIGDIQVKAFGVSHDTEDPVGYSFFKDGVQISIVTDTGHIDEEMFVEIKDANLLAIESNHEVPVLQVCAYPYFLKRRILSEEGHLSNDAAAECICRKLREGVKNPYILLAHLSKEANTPEMAKITVQNILENNGFFVGKDLELEVLRRDEMGEIKKIV